MIGLAIVDLRAVRWKVREVFNKISPDTLWLLCWIVGGLLVMSLIPSKRVDRIFPVLPPLCLLLAAQIGKREPVRAHVHRWSGTALLLSILFAGGYCGLKVLDGYRDHRDALVKFGRAVREEAAEKHWRYEVVESSDEGLLLYLQKLHFIQPEAAITEWNRGNVEALAAPAAEAPQLVTGLQGASISPLQSAPRKDGRDYVLIAR